MKQTIKNIALPIIFAGTAMFSTAANALLITDAGGFDKFLGSATLSNSGQSEEEAWVASILGVANSDVSMTYKDEAGVSIWTEFSDSNGDDYYYDFGVGADPEYYLLKLGNGGKNIDHSHYLFKNEGSLQYAAVSFLEAGVNFSLKGIGIDRISHTSIFNGGTTVVSEPATFGLLALGITGLVGARRRAKKLA